MKKNSNAFIIVVCVALFIVFVGLACLSGAWPSTDFASQILAALAGALVTSIITLLILQGQMASEEKKEKNSKIFEEKLRIYQDFMRELCEVVKDQKIDDEEKIRLQFQVASIAMHTTEENILAISDQIKEIITNIGGNGGNGKSGKEMLNQLFAISDVFHQELYKVAPSDNDKNRIRTIQNFHSFLEDDKKKYEEDCNRLENLISLIPANGSKQWIYDNCVLVHDYYTERGARGGFVKRGAYIGLDLTPIGDKLVLNVFSRSFVIEETLKIVQGISEGNEIKGYDGLNEARHVIRVFNLSDSNEEIASVIRDTLEKLKNYRDKNY